GRAAELLRAAHVPPASSLVGQGLARSTRPIVVSADKTYVDPSALRRLYVHDDRSRAFCAWRARLGGSLPVTLHGRAELVKSIALAVFRRDISAEAGQGALADVEGDIAAGRLVVVDLLWRRALKQAADLSQKHT